MLKKILKEIVKFVLLAFAEEAIRYIAKKYFLKPTIKRIGHEPKKLLIYEKEKPECKKKRKRKKNLKRKI